MNVIKKWFYLLFIAIIFVAGCEKNTEIINIDSDDELFNQQMYDSGIISALKNFFFVDKNSLNSDEAILSQNTVIVQFNQDSSLQGGINFSNEKQTLKNTDENSEISIGIVANSIESGSTPFELTGDFSLLYQSGLAYAQLHNFSIFMGEGNMNSKMYSLFAELLYDKWIDLEIENNPIISVNNENSDIEMILNHVESLLKISSDGETNSVDYCDDLEAILTYINKYVNLGFNTQEISTTSTEISYGTQKDNIIQKSFTGHFQSIDATFTFSFIASQKGINLSITDVKYLDENSDYIDAESEIHLYINNNKKSEYNLQFLYQKYGQNIANIEGKIQIDENVSFAGNFILEPLEVINGQKISGLLQADLSKSIVQNVQFPVISGNVLYFHDILESI